MELLNSSHLPYSSPQTALQKFLRIVRYLLNGGLVWPFFGKQDVCKRLKTNGTPGRIRTYDLWFRRAASLPYQIVTKANNNNKHFSPVFTGRHLPTITKSYQSKWEENGRTIPVGFFSLLLRVGTDNTDKRHHVHRTSPFHPAKKMLWCTRNSFNNLPLRASVTTLASFPKRKY